MLPTLQQKFDVIENERKQLFLSLQNVSDEKLNQKPNDKAWSIATVIRHLMMAEEKSLNYLLKKLQDTSQSQNTGWKNAWRFVQVKAVFFFNIKFKAPELVNPEETFNTQAELNDEWTALRSQLKSALEKISEEDSKKELWKHALAGKMNPNQMLDFFALHFSRHRGQIDRTVNAVA